MYRVSVRAFVAVTLFVFAVGTGCGPAKVDPTLDLSASPRSIDNKGAVTKLTVTAADSAGKPGTGKVTFSAPAGTLKAGGEVTLAAGTGTIDFACDLSADPGCVGTVPVTATWGSGANELTANANITILGPVPTKDAGSGDDGGSSTVDAGTDAGTVLTVFDGGVVGEYTVSLKLEKVVLLKGTGDRMGVTAHVTKTATPTVGVAGATVAFTAPGGASFAQTPTAATSATTDANGDAVVTLFVGTASSAVVLTASAFDASAYVAIPVANIALIEWASDPRTKTPLTLKSTGRVSSTPVFFRVTDSTTLPVQGVDVNFDIGPGSPAGCTVTNSGRTDAMGLVQTTLTSGEARGSVTVQAVVAATAGTSGERLAARSFEVIIGRPADNNFSLACTRKTLPALQDAMPPRNDLSSACTVSMADRDGAILPFAVDVLWVTEAGSLQSSTQSDGSGRSMNTYQTGSSLPVATTPFVGEPYDLDRNPRDQFVTIVAATNGEEQFWDGSGDGGVLNGQWDPGEWFVDQAEPFVDANDNGIYDDGEKYLDTERIDCATGAKQAKNMHWDGPNGCWDSSVLLWRPVHIIYTDVAFFGTGQSGPFLEVTYPSTVLNDATSLIPFKWWDNFYNRAGVDSITVAKLSGARGSASVTANNSGETWGHDLVYYTARGSETAGVVTETGTCDGPDRAKPTNGERCFRRFKIAGWRTNPVNGTLVLTGPPVNAPPGASSSSFQLVGNNSKASPTLAPPFSVTYPQ